MTPEPLSPDDLRFLDEAAQYLESPRFLMKIANLVGKPAEALLNWLPAKAQSTVGDVTQAALEWALDWAVCSLSSSGWPISIGPRTHMALTATTGAVGGLLRSGCAALEIPATTTLMLRSIAQIAANKGADLNDPDVRLQCLAVLSHGSPSLDAMESTYLSSRLGTALATREAAQYLAEHSAQEISRAVSRETAPVLVRFLNKIAARFQIVVTEKLAAQAVPVTGAAMGSLINIAFTDHFNRVAEFHFAIVRLERQYGREVVQAAYREAVERVRRGGKGTPNTASS